MFHKTGAGGRLASCSLESEDILHFNIKVNCELYLLSTELCSFEV